MFAINKPNCIPAEERGAVLRHLIKQLHESISQARPSRLLVSAQHQRHAFAVGRYNGRQLIGLRKQACCNAACFLARVADGPCLKFIHVMLRGRANRAGVKE